MASVEATPGNKRIRAVSTQYAVVKVFGRQFNVKVGDKIQANFTEGEVGKKLTFSDVLAVNSGTGLKVGTPLLSGAKVTATIQAQTRGEKILVFKYLRKNKLKKIRGHRQPYTVLTIDSIEG
jgi:large subunit ribosomal protein L21